MHGLDQGTGNSLAYYSATAHRRVYSKTIGVSNETDTEQLNTDQTYMPAPTALATGCSP